MSVAASSAIKASRRDKYKQVEEFVKLVRLAVSDARVGSPPHPRRASTRRWISMRQRVSPWRVAYLGGEKELGGDSPMK